VKEKKALILAWEPSQETKQMDRLKGKRLCNHKFNKSLLRHLYVRGNRYATTGNWENYYMMGEHTNFTDLLLNGSLKIVHFLWNVCQLEENSGCLDTGQPAVLCTYTMTH
jgi:hypothetical protein